MGALSLLNLALKEGPNIRVSPNFCKRVRFRKSDCQRCLEICPENAILLTPGPSIRGGCSGCCLCQRACPTEVFQSELQTDGSLLNHVRSLPDKRTISIRCHRTEDPSGHFIPVFCLGSISENILLGLALSGFAEIQCIKGICSRCRFAEAEALLNRSIMTTRVLLENLGLGDFPVRLMEKPKKGQSILTRREIFSRISSEAKNRAVPFLRQWSDPSRDHSQREKDKWIPLRRRLLRSLLKQRGWGNSTMAQHGPEFPWGRIRIDEKNCSACGTCTALCPTGAISKKFENNHFSFYFNGSLCTNCLLCREACPVNALDFEEEFDLRDLVRDRAEGVARVKLISCFRCGGTIPSGKSEFCPTCQKRQG